MIQELKLRNFKCFAKQSFPLGRVNVSAGLNSMGKSTVLQSLLLLKQSYMTPKNMPRMAFPNGIKLIPENAPWRGALLNGAYINLGVESDVFREDAEENDLSITVTGEDNIPLRFHFSYDLFTHMNNVFLTPTEGGLPDYDALSQFSDSILRRIFYLSADRITPRRVFPMADDINELAERELRSTGELAPHYLTEYGSLPVENPAVRLGDEESNTLLNQTARWMEFITPGTRVHVKTQPVRRTANVRYSFMTVNQERTREHLSLNAGFGLTSALPVIVQLLAAKPGDIVLLENPEAHIHPAGQSRLGELIARAGSGGVQVIVETHSDHIFNGIRLAVKRRLISCDDVRLFYFYQDYAIKDDFEEENPLDEESLYQHKVERLELLPDGRLKRQPKGFFDEWTLMLLRLLVPPQSDSERNADSTAD